MSLANKRIPGLDGLRAISIVLVLGGHLAGTRNCYSAALYGKFGDLANLGVRVFFVISGYLITTLLLKEYAKTQTVSLKNFYIRRTLRIFPAFYTFLLAMTFVQAWGLISLKSGDLLHAFTYTTNYHYDSSWWIGHTWSLSVEEQFYLLWPALLLLLGIRRGLYAAGAVVFMAPVVRIAVWYLWPAQRAGIGWSFPTIADTIATGCLLAGTRGWLELQPWYRKLLDTRWFAVVPLMIIAVNAKPGGRLRMSVLETVVNLLIAACVARCAAKTDGPVAMFLNSRPAVAIGIVSYSLYLWQQPFLNRHSAGWFAAFPVNIVLAVLAALLSYLVVEKPLLDLRGRFGERKHKAAQATAIVQAGSGS
jgi:peptidoglycan/LPS O-acetylase OafA/YrhL